MCETRVLLLYKRDFSIFIEYYAVYFFLEESTFILLTDKENRYNSLYQTITKMYNFLNFFI